MAFVVLLVFSFFFFFFGGGVAIEFDRVLYGFVVFLGLFIAVAIMSLYCLSFIWLYIALKCC